MLPKKPPARGNLAAPAGGHPSQAVSPRMRWWFRESEPVARFTGWVMCFTFILALIAGVQVASFVISERAYLTVPEIEFRFPEVNDTHTLIAVTIKNGGKEAAFITGGTITATHIPAGKQIPAEDTLPSKPVYQPVLTELIGPVPAGEVYKTGARLNLQAKVVGRWSEEITKEIQAGDVKLYIYGFIEYRDPFTFFGNSRTGFCVVYNTQKLLGEGKFIGCGFENYVYAK
jgi:hypothetical protein